MDINKTAESISKVKLINLFRILFKTEFDIQILILFATNIF